MSDLVVCEHTYKRHYTRALFDRLSVASHDSPTLPLRILWAPVAPRSTSEHSRSFFGASTG